MKRMSMVVVLLVMVFGLALAGPVAAQTVRNPTVVEFTVSADHASVTRYEFGFFLGGVDPVQSSDLGKCTPDAQQKCVQSLPSYPIGQTYTAKIRAFADTVASDWSAASNPFYKTPAPLPGPPVVR